MDWLFLLKSMIIGIVEGITEFLPVSSTGHMIIFEELLNFKSGKENYIEMYTYVIQLGAILAIVVLYREKIIDTIVKLFPKKDKVTFEQSGIRFWLWIAIACIPGLIAELTVGDYIEEHLFSSQTVAIALIIGGILMILMENKYRNNSSDSTLILTLKQVIIIGCFQCMAVIPGMSRSASTIMGAWFAGLSTVVAAEFSFFLAIPVMVGMSFLKIFDMGGFGTMNTVEWAGLIVGFVVSFVVALIVVDKFIAFLKAKPMRGFAIYRFIFAIFVLIAGACNIFHA